ncbi:MAG: flavin reductase [Gammaproteobacteria bacterium]|nr:flavin reductase [Gammaproteobacteria bacterium]NNF50464.1 flavin reductase [Woeseiaceae bacterium]MBT8093404.1 flavin reductase [Gammaproteobacteria bacterium]MBT8106198.1 flavin reductase [Gammaproteobacteria bacterium]NNK26212.1 flavin reductase [Woeseiaceae bacterium]
MNKSTIPANVVEVDTSVPVWGQFFTVAPLVLVGTRDADGSLDLAPKHMVTPMGWQNYFGFVCSPQHGTCSNIERTGVFTVSYPRPSQVLYTSLAATPRDAHGDKLILDYFKTFPAKEVDGEFIEDGYLFFECRHFKTVDGFGDNCLITGEIVAAWGDRDFLRRAEADDQETIHEAPLLAYLHPGRFATIDRSNGFPFPEAMKK